MVSDHAAITCVSLTLIPNGVITYAPDTSSPYDFGTNATYSCNDGFFLEGEGVRTCFGDGSNVNGDWNGSVPQCTGMLSFRSVGLAQLILLERKSLSNMIRKHGLHTLDRSL